MARWWRSDMRVNPGESYADIIDHEGEAADKMDRAIRSIEPEARQECGEFFADHTDDVWEEIIEYPAVGAAIEFAATSDDATEIGSKMLRALGMARIKFVNEQWTGWARWAIEHRHRHDDDYRWPSTRAHYMAAIALGGDL